MKKLFLAAALMLAGTFAKAQTITNDLPNCDIEVEVFCIPEGDCNALPNINSSGTPTYSFLIPAGQAVFGNPCGSGTDYVFRVRVLGNCTNSWRGWFGFGPCAPNGNQWTDCTDCGAPGGTGRINLDWNPTAGGLWIYEQP